MKKFTDFVNNGNNIENVKTQEELLEGLISDALRIENGVIVGKEIVIETINKMIEMNSHKTTIKVLENVRAKSYRGGLDFNWLNEAIDNETIAINTVTTRKAELIVEEIKEEVLEVINESIETEEVLETVEEIVNEEVVNEINWVEAPEVVTESLLLKGYKEQYMDEINTLSSIYEQIKLENNLTAKKDRIDFILDNCDDCTEEELKEMSDSEIEKKYKNIETK